MHRYHPDENRPDDRHVQKDVILYNDCERCAQHASWPLGLDNETLKAIISRTLSVEWGMEFYRTAVEAVAGDNIRMSIILFARMVGVPVARVVSMMSADQFDLDEIKVGRVLDQMLEEA